MEKLQCELCGSSDIVKDGDFFVCKYCGCKYTVEQAKKLMIEGVVNVQGKVSLENTDKINNLYVIARRARDNNDWDGAKKYYDLVLQEDPTSFEATFYFAYFDAYYCKNGELKIKSRKLNNCIASVSDLIISSNLDKQGKVDAFLMIGKSVIKISDSLQSRAKSFRNSMMGIKVSNPLSLLGGKDQSEYTETVIPMINCKYTIADKIETIISDYEEYPKLKELMIDLWKDGNENLSDLFRIFMSIENKNILKSYKNKILKYVSKEERDELIKEEKEQTEKINKLSTCKKFTYILSIASIIFSLLTTIIAFDEYLDSSSMSVMFIISIALASVGLYFGIKYKKSVNIITPLIVSIISLVITIFISFIVLCEFGYISL